MMIDYFDALHCDVVDYSNDATWSRHCQQGMTCVGVIRPGACIEVLLRLYACLVREMNAEFLKLFICFQAYFDEQEILARRWQWKKLKGYICINVGLQESYFSLRVTLIQSNLKRRQNWLSKHAFNPVNAQNWWNCDALVISYTIHPVTADCSKHQRVSLLAVPVKLDSKERLAVILLKQIWIISINVHVNKQQNAQTHRCWTHSPSGCWHI